MCLLLETIKLNGGILENLFYHNARLNAAREELFGEPSAIRLEKEIRIPDELKNGVFRCRVTYGRSIHNIEFVPVLSRNFRSLKVVRHDRLDYHLKYADRSQLNELYAQRENADEIIVIRNGTITDCTIGNLVLFDGERWITPDTPLLKGTQRQALLDRKLITEERIRETDLPCFLKVGIINALFNLENMPVIKKNNIF